MKKEEVVDRHALLNHLSHLPKKIVALEGIESTPEFILHELCHEHCFNISKAAFFVDNPDFDFIKGVAGFSAAEAYADIEDMWQHPQAFVSHMKQASFNQKVRQFSHGSVKRKGSISSQEFADQIVEKLGFAEPQFRSWQMKHDNHGFLIYEQNGSRLEGIEEHLNNSLYLLNFCPIF